MVYTVGLLTGLWLLAWHTRGRHVEYTWASTWLRMGLKRRIDSGRWISDLTALVARGFLLHGRRWTVRAAAAARWRGSPERDSANEVDEARAKTNEDLRGNLAMLLDWTE